MGAEWSFHLMKTFCNLYLVTGIIILVKIIEDYYVLKAKYIFRILCMTFIEHYYVRQAEKPQTACHFYSRFFGQ